MSLKKIKAASSNELLEQLVGVIVYECFRTMLRNNDFGKGSAKEIVQIADELSLRAAESSNSTEIIDIVTRG